MSNLPIQFIDKENSPELLAFMQQFGEQAYVDAELINKFRDAINELHSSLSPDRIISLGTETVEGNLRTYEGYKWQISGLQIDNIGNPIQLTFPSTTAGFRRNDISVFKPDGTIERIAGTETDGEVVSTPDVPEGTLYFKTYFINGDTVEAEPEPPVISGSQFKQKNESRKFQYTLSGIEQVIQLRSAGHQHYSVNGDEISIAGFGTSLLTSPTAEQPYSGKDIFLQNETVNEVTLLNAFSGVDIPFDFGSDLVVPSGGIVWLKYYQSPNRLTFFMKSWSDPVISNFKGKYTSKANLDTAYPTGSDGDYAIVDAGAGSDAIEYIWDNEEGWVEGNARGASSTDALAEGSTNLYFTTARVLATVLSGLSLATGGTIVSTDTVLQAFGKLQKQINDLVTSVGGKVDKVTTGSVRRVYAVDALNNQEMIAVSDLISAFSFEIPFFFFNRYTTSNFSQLGTSNGFINFNVDSGTSNYLALVPSSNTVLYRVPRACTLNKVLFYGNIANCEIAIYKSSTTSGTSATLVYQGAGGGAIDASGLNASINDGDFLHIFLRNNQTASNGTNNGRLFLTFK